MKNSLLLGLLLAGGSVSTALAQTPVFVRWPFTVSVADSAALRSANTSVGTPAFKKLVVADGSTSVMVGAATFNVKPYSSSLGLAFAPSAVGGNWGTGNGGPGGAVKRGIYVQVSVTAAALSTSQGLRADSLLLTSGFIGTASGTTLAVAYSKSAFVSDSAEATGTKGPAGTTASGNFTTPATLPQIAALPNTPNTFRVALNGATGVTLPAGQTLTVRLYFSCSSSGASGRYATIRNLVLKSKQAATLAARPALTSALATDLSVYPNPAQNRLAVPHAPAGADARLVLYSATGARLLAQPVAPGSVETTVPLDGLAQGRYLVEYSDGGLRRTTRIAKQ